MIQKIGEGWFSRVYLTEQRQTHQEVVLKAVAIDQRTYCNSYDESGSCNDEVPDDAEADTLLQINPQLRGDFLREYKNAYRLSTHINILTVYDIIFEVGFLTPCQIISNGVNFINFINNRIPYTFIFTTK